MRCNMCGNDEAPYGEDFCDLCRRVRFDIREIAQRLNNIRDSGWDFTIEISRPDNVIFKQISQGNNQSFLSDDD